MTIQNTIFGLGLVATIGMASTGFAQDTSRGEQLYVECAACHTFDNDDEEVGPGLAGLIGRQAGALENFYYSPALATSGITWNADTLNAFIADPQAAVPRNRMPYSGLTDAQDRADLIAYLMEMSE
jgi:cytochrome c